MNAVPPARRMAAVLTLVAVVAVTALLVLALVRHLLWLVVAVVCFWVAVASAAYAVTRTRMRRTVAAVVALLALAAPVVLLVVDGQLLEVLVLVALAVLAGGATRRALGRDIKSLKSGPTPGDPVPPARRPVLLLNPRSGGGKAERFDLVGEARRRGVHAIVLQPGDDLHRLAEQAAADGADVLGMAGGDGSQALVAEVAARHGLGFVCVPAGTRNHLAMDLGLDRDDVAGALDAFGEAVERRIDLGLADERVFVNNATAGLYAKIVQSPAYRDHKVATALQLLPDMLGPDATPFDLGFTGPDGTDHPTAHLILVSNDRYELGSGEGFGSRRRIDTGSLGIVAARFESAREAEWFARGRRAKRNGRPHGWLEWSDTSFEIRSGRPVELGLDGEALVLDPPIRFRSLPGALRVRIPRHAPGYSPAAAAPTPGWSTVTALLQTAAGRPVTIEP
jgi:diacylglycerol kinase family enzyme